MRRFALLWWFFSVPGLAFAQEQETAAAAILASTPWPSTTAEVLAQVVGQCGPGRACRAGSFTASAPSGSVAVKSNDNACWQIGSDVFLIRAASGNLRASTTCVGAATASISSSLFSSGAAAGQTAFAVVTGGARIDYGPGLNDWASSDGGIVHFESGAEIGAAGSGIGSLSVAGDMSMQGAAYVRGVGGISNNNVLGIPLLVADTEGLRLQGVATSALMPFDGGAQGGIFQYDTTTDTMKVATGPAASRTWKTINTGSALSDTREGALCGYWPLATVADGNPKTFAAHTSQNGGRSVGLQWVSTLVGAGAGGFVIRAMLPDAGELCATTTIDCNTAVGTPVSQGCGAGFLAGDLITLTYAGACTAGQNPTGNATLSFAE